VEAVVHTHSVHATAWSCLGEPLDTGVKELAHTIGGPVLTAVDARPGTDALGRAAVEALGERGAALLAHHGVVAVGESPAQALAVSEVVERHAQMAWLLRQAGC
jgi:L-fuculose-phosphate aldolase